MAEYFEHKVSVTLSLDAYHTIESDMITFGGNENWAGFINRVISNYKDESPASIKLAAKNEEDRLTNILCTSRKPLSGEQEKIVKKLVDDFSSHLRTQMNSFPSDKGTTKKIRINNQNFEDLEINSNSRYFSALDYRQAGLYIKALLEDYARQSFSQREKIIHKNLIQNIHYCICEKKTVKVKYTSRTGNETKIELIPFGVLEDDSTHYNYFVGIQKSPAHSDFQAFSLRLSRIRAVSIGSKAPHITQNIKGSLEAQVQSKGVAYLQGASEVCQVALSKNGVKMYNSILHLRPKFIHFNEVSDGKAILDFDCTDEQIKNYFLRFGKEAVLLSPESLHMSFKKWHNDAARTYNSDKT